MRQLRHTTNHSQAGTAPPLRATNVFRWWAEIVVRYPRMLVAAVLALTLAAGLSARHLRLSVEERDQLPQSHPYVQLYNRVNAIFGGGAATVIGLVARNGDVFDSPTLAKVERITRAVERRPEFAGAI